MYYVIQSKNPGYIEYVTVAQSAEQALQKFDDDIGIDPNNHGISVDDWDITQLTAEQYETLKDCDGTNQELIDYLESIKP